MEYQLQNGDGRVTTFTGVRLAHETSKRVPEQLRWTEISIYRTDGGNYVVHKVGRSVVVHAVGFNCTSGLPEKGVWANGSDKRPCPLCRPDLQMTNPDGSVVEQDRNTVHVSTSADGAVESCHSQDDDGSVYLTNAAKAALVKASEVDQAIADAFAVQRVE